MRTTLRITVAVLICLSGARLRAAGLTDYIDDKAIFAGEVDTRTVDFDALEKWLAETMKAAEMLTPADQVEAEKDIHQGLGEAKRWLADFQKAGGTSLYMLVNGSGFNQGEPVVIVAPLSGGAKENSIASLFLNGTPDGPTTRPVPKGQAAQWEQYRPRPEIVSGKAVLFGVPRTLAWAKSVAPKDRPDFSAALASAGDASRRVALAPTDAFRAFLKSNLPPNVMGQSTLPLSQGIVWISAKATPPPAPTGHIVIQAKDADNAAKIRQFISTAVAMGKLFNQGAGVKDPDDLMLLVPTIQKDQLVLDLDNDKFVKIARQMGPMIRKQRQQAITVASMSNMRQLLMGCVMYSNDHKGEWPDKLDAVGEYLGGSKAKSKDPNEIKKAKELVDHLMTNPVHPELKPGYIYVKPLHVRAGGQQMVMYESHTKFEGVNCGFADGHVERVADSKRFAELLQAAQDASGEKDSGL